MGKKFKCFDNIPLKTDYIKDKEQVLFDNVGYMVNRCLSMFTYENFPSNIPSKYLDLYLFQNGECFFTKENDEYYIFTGGQGGELDAFYRPTIYTVANPYLGISKNYKIGVDGVLIKNDTLEKGIIPLLVKYNSLIVENLLTMKLATINARTLSHFSAPDDATKTSAEKYLQDLENGKLGVIAENSFLDGVKVHTVGNTTGRAITELVELNQYLQAGMYNELGLDANYNMKREAISASEAQLNDDFLLPLVDNMLECRKAAFEEIKKLFGLEIGVEFSSSWRTNYLEDKAETKIYEETISGENEENSSQQENPAEKVEEVTEEVEETGEEEKQEEEKENPAENEEEETQEEVKEETQEEEKQEEEKQEEK